MARRSAEGTGNYYVLFTKRDPKAEDFLYGGYDFQTAKDYARISSQYGDPTEIYRGKPRLKVSARSYKATSGKRVRRYEQGKRVFPFSPEDLLHPIKLKTSEVPRTMEQYEEPLHMAANPAGAPMPTDTVNVIVFKSGRDWVGQLLSKHKDQQYREMLARAGRDDAFSDYALLSFGPKPQMTASENRRLKADKFVTIRMDTPNVEEIIDETWGTDIFPWRHNPSGGKKRSKKELISEIEHDPFMRQYVETMLWSTNDESDDSGGVPLEENYAIEDFTVEGLERIIADCEEFQSMAWVEDAIDDRWRDAAHDFWLTRNGHGAGFWDGDWPENEATLLTDASEEMGEMDVYVGDNDHLYFA